MRSSSRDAERSVVRCDMEEAANKLPVFIINVILNRKNQIVGAVSGDVVTAHREGIKIFRKMAEIYLDEPVDLVIVEGGYPGSISFYQALFGCNVVLTTRRSILKKEGIIILFAQCKEGIGNNVIEDLFKKYQNPNEVLWNLKNNPPIPGQWAVQFLASFLINSHLNVITTDISKEKLQRLGLTCFNSIQEALDFFISRNDKLKIAVIKDPDFIIPNLKK